MGRQKVFGCVYIPNSNNLKIWKWGVTLEQCERSRWLRSHTNFEFCIQTSSQRWTSSRNRLAQVESFNQNKNGLKSSDTLSLGLRKKGAPDFWIFCQGNFAKCSILCELSMDLHHVSQLSLSGCIYSVVAEMAGVVESQFCLNWCINCNFVKSASIFQGKIFPVF